MFNTLGIEFHWYGFLIGIGVWVAMEISLKNRRKILKEVLEKAMWWSIGGGIVGARIYHVVDYWDKYYSSNLVRVLYFWEGGLGIWGAILGGVLGLILFCWFNKLSFLKYLDVLILGVPLAQAIGRIGNYLNGELYGKNGEPLFAYESALNLLLFLVMRNVFAKQKNDGRVSGVYLVGYGVIRAVLENIRPEEIIWRLGSVPTAVVFSLSAILIGSFLIFRKRQS